MIAGKSFLFIIIIKYIYMIGGGRFLFILINDKNIIEGKSFFIYYNKAHFITKRPSKMFSPPPPLDFILPTLMQVIVRQFMQFLCIKEFSENIRILN